MIAEHAEGLIVLLGPASDVGQAVTARRPDLARQFLDKWRNRTPDVVVEIVDHLDWRGTFRAARMAELAAETGTPAVLTNAVRYLVPADSRAAQVLDAARHLVPLGSPRLVPQNGRAYLASQANMVAVAERISAAMSAPHKTHAVTRMLRATAELADKCALDPLRDLGIGAHHLPESATPVKNSTSSTPAATAPSPAATTARHEATRAAAQAKPRRRPVIGWTTS